MNKDIHSLRLKSYLNGVISNLPGSKGLEKQIDIESSNNRKGSYFLYFAMGYTTFAYPAVVATGLILLTTLNIL